MPIKTFINELNLGDQVNSIFLAKNLQVRQRKNGEPFLTMELCDRSGSVPANMWEGFGHLNLAQVRFLKVQGVVNTYPPSFLLKTVLI